MKSERNAAMIMMTAAMLGLVLANSPFGGPLLDLIAATLNLEPIGIKITVGHIISDLFLAVFFFAAGLELKYELKTGALSSPKKAMVPVIAASAGVIVPSAIYAYLNWGTVESSDGLSPPQLTSHSPLEFSRFLEKACLQPRESSC